MARLADKKQLADNVQLRKGGFGFFFFSHSSKELPVLSTPEAAGIINNKKKIEPKSKHGSWQTEEHKSR